MNVGKLDVVKQEIATVNIDILWISELKWAGMGDFNSMTIIPTSMGKNPLEEMKSPSVNSSSGSLSIRSNLLNLFFTSTV